ncbi:MAG: hypothetical protein ACI9BC_000509, partial [Crocinitomicaceae bacterium]
SDHNHQLNERYTANTPTRQLSRHPHPLYLISDTSSPSMSSETVPALRQQR